MEGRNSEPILDLPRNGNRLKFPVTWPKLTSCISIGLGYISLTSCNRIKMMFTWKLTSHRICHMLGSNDREATKTATHALRAENTLFGHLGILSPLSVGTPIPHDAVNAAIFRRDFPPGKLRSFWDIHLIEIEKLVRDSILEHRNWGGYPGRS